MEARHRPCDGCAQVTTFSVWSVPRPWLRAYSTVCLACGYTTVEHVHHDSTLHETPVAGKEWTPPCVAVARLREALFSRGPFVPPKAYDQGLDDD
jgi:hypothetical protein